MTRIIDLGRLRTDNTLLNISLQSDDFNRYAIRAVKLLIYTLLKSELHIRFLIILRKYFYIHE